MKIKPFTTPHLILSYLIDADYRNKRSMATKILQSIIKRIFGTDMTIEIAETFAL